MNDSNVILNHISFINLDVYTNYLNLLSFSWLSFENLIHDQHNLLSKEEVMLLLLLKMRAILVFLLFVLLMSIFCICVLVFKL